jgi:hypothetical protein
VKELLKIIKKNREAHREIFEKALEGYRKACIAELESMLADARAKKRIRRAIHLVEPMDQTKEYDRIISMLKLTSDTEIELDQSDYANYVLDDWHWKEQFTMSTAGYMN